jgi:hypothetical protein
LNGGEKVNELLTPVANVGFPIVLSIYLLVRLEGKIEGLSDSVHELAKSITGLGKSQP